MSHLDWLVVQPRPFLVSGIWQQALPPHSIVGPCPRTHRIGSALCQSCIQTGYPSYSAGGCRAHVPRLVDTAVAAADLRVSRLGGQRSRRRGRRVEHRREGLALNIRLDLAAVQACEPSQSPAAANRKDRVRRRLEETESDRVPGIMARRAVVGSLHVDEFHLDLGALADRCRLPRHADQQRDVRRELCGSESVLL